jgi:pSer/pThr/pTyr-binding forkhead associated (FHA) protein
MYSLEYAKTLVDPLAISHRLTPSLLAIAPSSNIPGQITSPRQTVFLQKPLTLMGRDSTCGIRIQDKFVSRFQASITRFYQDSNETYWLRDGDGRDRPSANGIYVNKRRVTEPHCLQDWDQLILGTRVRASFHLIRVPTAADHEAQHPLLNLLQDAGLLSPQQREEVNTATSSSNMLATELILQKGWLSLDTLEFFYWDLAGLLPHKPGKHPVGDYLKTAGLLTETEIVEALRLQKRDKVYFGTALIQKTSLKEQTLDFFLRRYADPQASQTYAHPFSLLEEDSL